MVVHPTIIQFSQAAVMLEISVWLEFQGSSHEHYKKIWKFLNGPIE